VEAKRNVFEEPYRRCAIDRKGRGRKEVRYLRDTDGKLYARGTRGPLGLSMEAPAVP